MPPAKPSRRPLLRAFRSWRARHQHPLNVGLHLAGIPMTVIGLVLLFLLPWHEWYWGVGLFVLGYLLQWLGHLPEGNDMGEWAAIKRFLGLPYNATSPIWLRKQQALHSAAPTSDCSTE